MKSNKINLDKIKNKGLISSKEIQKYLGVSQSTVSVLVRDEKILKLSYGVYSHPDLKIPPSDLDFSIACAIFGKKSSVGGLSALFYYGLIDQAPSKIWVVVEPSRSDNNPLYRVIRTKLPYKAGIDSHEFYRITNIERTILEALKLAEKIGPRVAINAARVALKNGQTTEKKLGEMATKLKLRSVLKKYWEAIVV